MVTKWWHATSYAMAGLIPAAFLFGSNPVVDYGLALVLPLHSQIGLNMVITDYVPPALRSAARGVTLLMTLVALIGMLSVNMRGDGVVATVGKVWHADEVKKEQATKKEEN